MTLPDPVPAASPRRSRALELALAALGFSALTLLYLRPIWRVGARRLTPDLGDPLFVVYILKWGAHQARLGFPGFWNAPFFYPLRGVTALSDHLLGPALVATAWTGLGGGPIAAYNLILAASFVLCGWSAFYVLRRSGVEILPALAGGAIFAFSPFRWEQIQHLQVLVAGLVPLVLWSWDRLLAGPSWRRAAGFVALYALHLSGGAYLAYMIHVPLAVLLANRLATPGPAGRAGLLTRRSAAILLATGASCGALAAAIFRPYWEVSRALHLARNEYEARFFGASLVSFVTPSRWNLYGGWFPAALRRQENALFAGFLPTLLAGWAIVAGLRRYRRRPLEPLALWRRVVLGSLALAAVAGYLAGETETWANLRTFAAQRHLPAPGYPAALLLAAGGMAAWLVLRRLWGGNWPLALGAIDPWERGLLLSGVACLALAHPLVYAVLMKVVPGLAGMRVPARFYTFVSLAVALLAARGFQAILRSAAGRRRALFALVAVTVSAGLVLELAPRELPWIPVAQESQLPPVYAWLAGRRDVRALVELPLGDVNSEIGVLYRGTRHWRPLVNGYSGYLPPSYLSLRAEGCFPMPEGRALDRLRRWQVTHVLLHTTALRQPWERRALKAWEAKGEGALVYDDGADRVYRILPGPVGGHRLPTSDQLPAPDRLPTPDQPTPDRLPTPDQPTPDRLPTPGM